MKLSRNEKFVYGVFILVLIMINPPILNIVNSYVLENPLTLGWPTMFIWLEFWYLVAIIDFFVGIITIKSWKKDYDMVKFKSKK
ncbi:MAG: hypothetical protein MUO60_15240 [Clostridiaceae bacterium]|nr:hypothetical protein [Clostridiaceae bacterium]